MLKCERLFCERLFLTLSARNIIVFWNSHRKIEKFSCLESAGCRRLTAPAAGSRLVPFVQGTSPTCKIEVCFADSSIPISPRRIYHRKDFFVDEKFRDRSVLPRLAFIIASSSARAPQKEIRRPWGSPR
jgi:hypothetical protein